MSIVWLEGEPGLCDIWRLLPTSFSFRQACNFFGEWRTVNLLFVSSASLKCDLVTHSPFNWTHDTLSEACHGAFDPALEQWPQASCCLAHQGCAEGPLTVLEAISAGGQECQCCGLRRLLAVMVSE